MVERIIPKTEALAERERKAIADMRALFPDGNVSGLDTVDKSLGKRLSKLYVALGYESRSDMIEALGFRQERTNYGRPALDHEAIIAEIAERYEGMEKPKTLGILIYENPDMKSQLKTISNKANELFGQSLAKELKARGLLSEGSKSEDVSEEDIKELLDALAEKYANAPIKPNSMSELKADNPESKTVLTAFNDRCRLIFGIPARKKLVELGIFEKPKGAVIDANEDEINQAIDEIASLVMELDDDEKPKTLSDLQKAYPGQEEYIKAGKKMGLIDKGPLQEIGILAPTRALLKREGIRRASAESLVDDYKALGRPKLIKPDDADAALLPPYIAGIDIAAKAELREFITTAKGAAVKQLSEGGKVAIDVAHLKREWGDPYVAIRIQTTPLFTVELGSLSDDALGNSSSPLSAYMGGEVVSISHGEDFDAAQIRIRYLAELKGSTIAYVLRVIGIVTEKDVRGSMEWRYRLKGAISGNPAQFAAESASSNAETSEDEKPEDTEKSFASDGLVPLQRSEYESVGDEGYAFMGNPDIPERLKEYLEVIANLSGEFPHVRSADVVARVGCSKSTFSAALQKLKDAGCVVVDDGYIKLQDGARDKASGVLLDYIDAIEDLYLEPPRVRSADVVAAMGCAKTTFSNILQKLRDKKLVMEKDGYIMLTTKVALVGASQGSTAKDNMAKSSDDVTDAFPFKIEYANSEIGKPTICVSAKGENGANAEIISSRDSGVSQESISQDDSETGADDLVEERVRRDAEEQARKEAEEAARKAEEERKRKEAEEAEEKRIEEEKRKAEEAARKAEEERKRQEEEAARKEEEKARAHNKFFELDEKIKNAKERKATLSKPVETASEKAAAKLDTEIKRMEMELSSLGFFARSKKKELQSSIAAKMVSLNALKAKIPAERVEAESTRKDALSEVNNEINALQAEIAPFRAIVLEDIEKTFEGKQSGDNVSFGSYKQESASSKATPIEWTVLETKDDRMLLLSKKVLACRKFKNSKAVENTYEASDLRKWLCNTFAVEAFSAADRQVVVGEPFILDAVDLKKYLPSDSARQCAPTEFAISQGAEVTSYYKAAGNTFYWVGTPEGGEKFYYVNPHGAVLGGGGYAFIDGMSIGNYGQDATYESGVRPAVWVQSK